MLHNLDDTNFETTRHYDKIDDEVNQMLVTFSTCQDQSSCTPDNLCYTSPTTITPYQKTHMSTERDDAYYSIPADDLDVSLQVLNQSLINFTIYLSLNC